MSRVATATLQTPWDCKWSRFGRMHTTSPNKVAEGLWVCVYSGARRPVQESECETCPNWEYAPALLRMEQPSRREASAPSQAVAGCPHLNRAERRIEIGTRAAALALAALLAGMGFVVLTSPLAVPLTISLWMGAVTSFLFGVWGRFNRKGLADESW